MTSRIAFSVSAVISTLIILAAHVTAQSGDPDAGSPPFVMSVKGQIDQFNLPSGNILIQLPVRSKAGKYPTTFSLVGNSHAYIGPPPQNSNYTGQWFVSSGFSGALSGSTLAQNVGTYITNQIVQTIQCTGLTDNVYGNFAVVESNGTGHQLPAGDGPSKLGLASGTHRVQLFEHL